MCAHLIRHQGPVEIIMADNDAEGEDDDGTNQVPTPWKCLEAAMSSLQDSDSFYFDPRGDLTLHVAENDTTYEFVVCSRTLARSSSVFCRMLYGGFAESNSTENKWIVNLPDDLPLPLFLILYIIHGLVDDLPKVLGQDELYEVLVVTEKYDMTKVLWPCASAWFTPFKKVESIVGNETLFWISWELGQKDVFSRFAKELMFNVGINAEGELLGRGAIPLSTMPCLWPHGILGMFSRWLPVFFPSNVVLRKYRPS